MRRTRTIAKFGLVILALCLLLAYLAYRNGLNETVSPPLNDAQSDRRVPDASPPSNDVQLVRRIPEGMRAVAIRVDNIGEVSPDGYVDVMATRNSHSILLLRNAKVLAVGQRQSYGNREEAVVTIVVTPKEAQKLASLREGTRIALAMAGKPV